MYAKLQHHDTKRWNQYAYLIFAANEAKVTDEAAAACYLCGVEPRQLLQRGQTGDPLRDKLDEKKRQNLIVIVGNQILELRQSQNRMHKPQRIGALEKNPEERAIQAAINRKGLNRVVSATLSNSGCKSPSNFNSTQPYKSLSPRGFVDRTQSAESEYRTHLKVLENKEAIQDKHAKSIRLQMNKSFDHDRKFQKEKKEQRFFTKLLLDKKYAHYQNVKDRRKSKNDTIRSHLLLKESQSKDRMNKAVDYRARRFSSQVGGENQENLHQLSGYQRPRPMTANNTLSSRQQANLNDSYMQSQSMQHFNNKMSHHNLQDQYRRHQQDALYQEATDKLSEIQERQSEAQRRRDSKSARLVNNCLSMQERCNEKRVIVQDSQQKKHFERFCSNIQHRLQLEKKRKTLDKDNKFDAQIKKTKIQTLVTNAAASRDKQSKDRQKKMRQLTEFHNKIFIPTNGQNDAYKDYKQERQELHNLEYQRRQKMRTIHKEIIVTDMIERQNRTDQMLRTRDLRARQGSLNQFKLKDLISNCKTRGQSAIRPVQMEVHMQEWQNELRRIKKAKEQGHYPGGHD